LEISRPRRFKKESSPINIIKNRDDQMMDRHVIEALGKTRIVVEDGKVTEVGMPEVRYCPLFYKMRGIEEFTPEVVRQNIEFRIKDFGMCTPDRQLRMKDFLSFGVSELMGMAVADGMLDCAVIVCDGAGTIVVSDPELIQGIGGRISGIISTTPISEIIETIGRENVLDPERATIDQQKGVDLAYALGYKKIGVTISSAQDARDIRMTHGQKVAIFAVHGSGRTLEDAGTLFDNADIITACGSKNIRAVAKDRKLFQVGNKVPIFAASLWGDILLQRRLEFTKITNVTTPEDPPRPLI
jgi:putative methanogenesis marker protein 8